MYFCINVLLYYCGKIKVNNRWGQSDSTGYNALTSHMSRLGLIPGTVYGLLSTAKIEP